MRTKVYFRDTGEPIRCPPSRDRARQLRQVRYDDIATPCSSCRNTARYTANTSCVSCAVLGAAKVAQKFYLATGINGRAKAVEAGYEYYYTGEPCKRYGHDSKQTLDGECHKCATEPQLSPRQKAMHAGEQWYMPNTPCKIGHVALRGVANGMCKECWDESRKHEVPRRNVYKEILIQNQYPDLLITRTMAKATGMKVFRTGQACMRGHTGFRRVSNGGCLQCLKEGAEL